MRLFAEDFALFEYENNPSPDDKFKLGDVVISTDGEDVRVGVIIQCHGNNEYRTDQFGNCCYSEIGEYSNIERANLLNIIMNRISLLGFRTQED